MAKKSVALVIDADIARASSKSPKPTPSNCRAFLEAVRACSHRLVMTPEIRAEWKKHRSAFARKWQKKMYGSKQVRWVEPEHVQKLWEHVEQAIEEPKQRNAVLKDFHLVEAGLETDKRIASMDEKVRALLSTAAEKKGARALKDIMWVNPNMVEEGAVAWVQAGAPDEKECCLGN